MEETGVSCTDEGAGPSATIALVEFFKTSEGRLHGLRIAGVIYTIGLLPGCLMLLSAADPMCAMRITYTAGWWLSFGDKRPAQAVGDLLSPRRLLGVILVVLGLIGSFYFIRHDYPR